MIRQHFNGHSGCKVWREGDVVYKECLPDYAQRLQRQVELTEQYSEEFGDRVFVPPMKMETKTRASMKYVGGLGWLEFIEQADYTVVSRAIDRICVLALAELSAAEIVATPASLWLNRLASVWERLPNDTPYQPYLRAVSTLLQSQSEWEIPFGLCHGDLTCSNLLFHPSTGALTAVDVLDCIPQTPLWDIAKLKQDAWYHWTLTNAGVYDNIVKVLYCDTWLRRRMIEELQVAFQNPLFQAIEALVYLRIAPYARTETVHRFLQIALSHTLTGESE